MDYGLGESLLGDGFIHVTGEIRDRERTSRAGVDGRQQYFDGDPRNDEPSLNDLVTFRLGDPQTLDRLVMFNGELPSSDAATCYFFGGTSYRQSEAGGFFRTPQDNRNVRSIYWNRTMSREPATSPTRSTPEPKAPIFRRVWIGTWARVEGSI